MVRMPRTSAAGRTSRLAARKHTLFSGAHEKLKSARRRRRSARPAVRTIHRVPDPVRKRGRGKSMPDGASAMIGKVAGKPPEEMTGAEYLGTQTALGWE